MLEAAKGKRCCAWLVLFGAMSIAGHACDTGEEDEGGGPEPASCRDVAQAKCAYYQNCARFVLSMYAGDMATCEQREELNCDVRSAAPGVKDDSEQTREDCYTKWASCPITTPPECQGWTGTLSDGAGCMFDEQCASGRCSGYAGECGTCMPLSGEGQECGWDSHCVEGLKCHTGIELVGTCVVPVPVGGSCEHELPCVDGAYCSFDPDWLCKVVPGPGEPCDGFCASPYWCNDGVCAEQSGEGGPCEQDHDCRPGLYCILTGDTETCGPVTFAAAGQPCDNEGIRCAAGSTCVIDYGTGEGVCHAMPVEGQPCLEGTYPQCLWPAFCGDDGMCHLPEPSSCG